MDSVVWGNLIVKSTVTFGLALCVTLVVWAIPHSAEAHHPRSQFCGVVTYKQGYSITPWGVEANGLACTRAKRIAKDVAKSYAQRPGKKWRVSGWACADKSGWVVPDQYGQSRIVCKKAGQYITLSWGA